MIQRQQSLWLILAMICTFLSFQFPFVTGKEPIENSTALLDVTVDAASDLFLLLMTGASIGLALVTIFMFKDRKLQMKLCIIGILLSLGIIARYIWKFTMLIKPVPALWSVLPFLALVAYAMACRGIRHDERLVKSLDKLR